MLGKHKKNRVFRKTWLDREGDQTGRAAQKGRGLWAFGVRSKRVRCYGTPKAIPDRDLGGGVGIGDY